MKSSKWSGFENGVIVFADSLQGQIVCSDLYFNIYVSDFSNHLNNQCIIVKYTVTLVDTSVYLSLVDTSLM